MSLLNTLTRNPLLTTQAIAVTDNELTCFHISRYILRHHKNLTENEIDYTANYISSLYDYNSFSLDQLIMFLVYADVTGISKFALTFNQQLDNAIKTGNSMELNNLILGPKEMFVEVYDNSFLSIEDRDFIIRLLSREQYSMKMVYELVRRKVLNLETIDDKCYNLSFSSEISKDIKATQITGLTTKCYEEVCIYDARILDDDEVRGAMSFHEKSSDKTFTIDKSATSNTPQVYCFDTLELIAAVSTNKINPKTGEKFDDYALSLIQGRFHKEIAMYRRYLTGKI